MKNFQTPILIEILQFIVHELHSEAKLEFQQYCGYFKYSFEETSSYYGGWIVLEHKKERESLRGLSFYSDEMIEQLDN